MWQALLKASEYSREQGQISPCPSEASEKEKEPMKG